MLPEDPVMLQSILNMKLRDSDRSFEDLCEDLDISAGEILDKMKAAGFNYDPEMRRFR